MALFRRERTLKNYRMAEDQNPICPACNRDIDGLMSRSIKSDGGRGYVWVCPRCYTILGVSHRSGYILG